MITTTRKPSRKRPIEEGRLPTPAEIRRRTDEIQRAWTRDVRESRRQMAIVHQERLLNLLSRRSAA